MIDVNEPAVLRIVNDERLLAMVTERIEADEISYRQTMDAVRAAVAK